jgi:hypothetical protein
MRFIRMQRWAGVAAVLLIAGCAADDQAGSGAERTGKWTRLPASPLSARHDASGVWVAGRFVVVGGWSTPMCPPTADCASSGPAGRDGAGFDPAAGTWTRIAEAPVPISGSNVVAVAGQVYLQTPDLGREDSPARFISYDPGRDTWSAHPNPPGTGGALVAAGDAVLSVSGSAEGGPAVDAVFDPKTDAWKELPGDPLAPSFERAAVWVNGSLLLTAKNLVSNPGAEEPSLVRLARLDGLTRWTALPDSKIVGSGPMAVGSRAVWPMLESADGGDIGNWGGSYDLGGIFDLPSGEWQPLPRPPRKSGVPDGTVVVGRRILVGGHLLDPVTRRWIKVPELPGDERASVTMIGSPDALLVWGGGTTDEPSANLATGYLLRPG